ncbi:MAG: MerR family transcriptional regulator [Bacillus sp. (in: Bacteria)]|nr:MerR family transcriptional regulator [Bacillus sp. (in: firmicutes)]
MKIEGKYNIKAVSKMLDIQPGTLRAWERRYKFITPLRNKAGHRLYTEAQVANLKWLIEKVNQGFTIGQAVELLEREDPDTISLSIVQGDNRLEYMRKELLTTLIRFEETKSQKIIDQAFSLFNVETVVIELLGKILEEVGRKWEQGEITVAHEHYISSFIKHKIGMVFHHMPSEHVRYKAVCFCAPSEMHEIGLLIFSLYLRRKGFETIFLGNSIPKEDIVSVMTDITPNFGFISCTIGSHILGAIQLATSLKEIMPEVKVGIGGQGVHHLSKLQKEMFQEFLIGEKEEEWESWLRDSK